MVIIKFLRQRISRPDVEVRSNQLGQLSLQMVGVSAHGGSVQPPPTSLDNGRRSPRKLLRPVVARLLGRKPNGRTE